MKKKNCRMTDQEREQHDRAVRFRKMTDAQICEYLDGMEQRAESKAAPVPSKGEIVSSFLDALGIRGEDGMRVSDATIRKLRAIAVNRGFIQSQEITE